MNRSVKELENLRAIDKCAMLRMIRLMSVLRALRLPAWRWG